MKITFFGITTLAAMIFLACNNGDNKKGHENHAVNNDTVQHGTNTGDKEVKAVAVTYSNVDVKAAASIKEIVDHYLHVKNALANDIGGEAASGAKAMEKTIRGLDKSLLTAEQKKLYDEIEEDLEEHAEHIGRNGDNISHQREHFSMMSEGIYELATAFGGGRVLYHDHCPMYNKDKGGAMWLSEMKEVKNPYFGAGMPTCGTVEEVIK